MPRRSRMPCASRIIVTIVIPSYRDQICSMDGCRFRSRIQRNTVYSWKESCRQQDSDPNRWLSTARLGDYIFELDQSIYLIPQKFTNYFHLSIYIYFDKLFPPRDCNFNAHWDCSFSVQPNFVEPAQ